MSLRLFSECRNSRLPRTAQVAAVALMLGLWLGLVGAASSERLHGLLHADAHHASHDCLVTHFAEGQFLVVGGAVFAMAAVFFFFFLMPRAERFALPAADVGLPSSRGPPVGSLLP
jgi:hypothetical protein